jgi:hypothetical protein
MIKKRTLALSTVVVLVLIFALNAVLRMVTAGETDAATPQAGLLLTFVCILAAPVMVYNHFTHANEGPITTMQIVLLITSSVFWGFVIERITHVLKRRKGGELQ